MNHCRCREPHRPRRVVLTGGPGAGKTAVLETIRRSMCRHVQVLAESAGIVFGGGFPRGTTPARRRPAQRAIYYVQRELEALALEEDPAIVLCDRGTVDGLAYWPGPENMWQMLGTTLDEQLARYDAVIHLRTPPIDGGYNRANPLRIETAEEAARIDERIAEAWATHPHVVEVPATSDFVEKAVHAIELVRGQLPACCRPRLAATA